MTPNMRRFFQQIALPAALVGLAAAAHAGVVPPPLPLGWDESINGDLSGDGLSPTFVAVVPGTATNVIGSTGRTVTGGPVDRDYFRILIPAGFELSSLTVLPGTMPLINVGFIGVMNSSTFTVPPDTQSAAGLLGFALYSENDIGNDILPAMGIPALGSSGFTPPLPAGDYSFWVQETGTGAAPYGFSFAVTAVPEPATAFTLLAGLTLLAAALKRR